MGKRKRPKEAFLYYYLKAVLGLFLSLAFEFFFNSVNVNVLNYRLKILDFQGLTSYC
jgi:hypothetical protein